MTYRLTALLSALALSGCVLKATDTPASVRTVQREWRGFAECVYTDLITNQGKTPRDVAYAPMSGQAMITVSTAEGAKVIFKIAPMGTGAEVTLIYGVLASVDYFDDMAEASIKNCGG